jgi:hypothetical protein
LRVKYTFLTLIAWQLKCEFRNWRKDVSNAAKTFLQSKPALAANRPSGSAADPKEPTDAQKLEAWHQAMFDRHGDTFLLYMKHLEAKDIGVKGTASAMDSGVHR